LLKSVDGLLAGGVPDVSERLIAELTAQQLSDPCREVDAYFSQFLQSASLEPWVISGLYPERLAELLATGQTIGTRIRSR
jgi:aspartokinase-like uncharacterized kinase